LKTLITVPQQLHIQTHSIHISKYFESKKKKSCFSDKENTDKEKSRGKTKKQWWRPWVDHASSK
jgi:hypothetical protein